MVTNSFDLNQSKALLTQCFYRGVTKAASPEIRFSEDFLLRVQSWLVDCEICFTEPRGLLSLISSDDKSNELSSGPYYRGYLDFVRTLLSSDARETIPMDMREFEDEQIEMAAAIVQLTCRPDDEIGNAYVEFSLREAEKNDLHQQLGQSRDHASFLMEKLTPHLLRYREMAARPRSKSLTEVLETLALELKSHDPKVLWGALIQRFNDWDQPIRDVFDGLVADESGLKNQTTLKAAPYKCVYMDSIKSGPKKGKEKYLTYQRFRYHLKKIKQ
jgi:hypothetical protein